MMRFAVDRFEWTRQYEGSPAAMKGWRKAGNMRSVITVRKTFSVYSMLVASHSSLRQPFSPRKTRAEMRATILRRIS